jgi:hypothetical protein
MKPPVSWRGRLAPAFLAAWASSLCLSFIGCRSSPSKITPEQAIAAKTDLYGEAALGRPQGPTYDYFASLLPPLRYVDADFRCYPIVLCAPNSPVKGRLVSDGSAINALARQPVWQNEMGTPAIITVGDDRAAFGQNLGSLDGPHCEGGYLPIYALHYSHRNLRYGEEVFASVDEQLAKSGAILVRFELPKSGRLDLHLAMPAIAKNENGSLVDKDGSVLLTHDGHWDYYPGRNLLVSKEGYAGPLYVVILTKPAHVAPVASPAVYQQQRELAERFYRGLLARGAKFEVPEPIVNNAWRVCLLQNFAMLSGNQMNYSAGNQYARQYAHESGESQRGLILYGHADTVRETFTPLFIYRRENIEYHDGAFKLIDLAFYYAYTHDDALIEQLKPLWQKEIDLLVNSRESLAQSRSTTRKAKTGDASLENDVAGAAAPAAPLALSESAHDGLLPREKYCSDIATNVHSLNTNANAWRGLRDMSILLHDERLAKVAAEYRKTILATMDKAMNRGVDPPFIPIALGGEEDVHDPITATRIGSYWNLVVQSLLGSEVFPYDSPYATDVMRYMQTKGGLCMGLIRVQSERSIWMNRQNIDDLYGTRYAILLDQRDEADRALVSFYAKLAQGMTRETCVDGESSSIFPTDAFGRAMYLPPNSTANSYFLQMLRYLLIQDFDMHDSGRADTLRLCFGTPRGWLEDGKTITVKNAPTAFGEVSFTAHSDLLHEKIVADVSLPARPRDKTLIRFRVPYGWRISGATTGGKELPAAGPETFDISSCSGQVSIVAHALQK